LSDWDYHRLQSLCEELQDRIEGLVESVDPVEPANCDFSLVEVSWRGVQRSVASIKTLLSRERRNRV
jgi:hypothetical protein